MSGLRKILDALQASTINTWRMTRGMLPGNDFDLLRTGTAKEIKELFLDLIGPDERIEYHEFPSVITRNEFREELRKKVEEL